MSIVSVLRTECILSGSGAADKQGVLRTIAGLAKKCSILDTVDEKVILDGLQKREEIASTGFEDGIAIPHCFIEGIEDFVVGILVEPEGIDFAAMDGELTTIFVFIVGPESERNRHIKYLSNISHTLRIPEVRLELIKAGHAASISESFLRHSSVETESSEQEPTCLCTIYIQNEGKFEPILEVLLATDTRSISVVEANDANYFLNKMPLFASILSGQSKGFHRIITAVIAKSLVNEVIRQIDLEIKGLEKTRGVTIIVQENTLTYGTLVN